MSTADQITLLRLANYPKADWEKMAEAWLNKGPGFDDFPTLDRRPSMQDAVDTLDSMIVGLSRFREYIDERHGNGSGDQGHASAVKAQNKLAQKIRKALGFTYPKQDIDF